jgi:hypothetical protein
VGTSRDASNVAKLKLEEGSAEYSYKDLEAFRALLEAKLERKVGLRKRIIAASFPTPP